MDKDELRQIRSYLKHNIMDNNKLFGYEKERDQIFDLLKRTVECGESNSALLIGPRGCGKTTLVNDVLRDLTSNISFVSDAILVKLHGLVHTDDRLALKSTSSQMNLDNVVDGKVFGTFAEHLAFLLACLRSGEKHTSKSELTCFVLITIRHCYTILFDVSQSAQTPICVLGITCRLDVIELLEKRVKSRFSHRQIFLFPCDNGDNTESTLDRTLKRIEYYLLIPEKSKVNINSATKKHWNKNVKALLEEKKFKNAIQRLVDIDLNERTLKNILFKVLCRLKDVTLCVDDFQEEISLLEKDDMVQVLQDLNVLELCIVISMKHHSEIYDNQPMNFEMILSRYIKFANANSNIQTVQRPVIMKAFEHIQNLELISMISSAPRVQKEYQFFKLLVTPKQISEAIKNSLGLPTEVIQWAVPNIE
ncbi:hypothetical protein NQ318_004060, partial [Aromia moschata]